MATSTKSNSTQSDKTKGTDHKTPSKQNEGSAKKAATGKESHKETSKK